MFWPLLCMYIQLETHSCTEGGVCNCILQHQGVSIFIISQIVNIPYMVITDYCGLYNAADCSGFSMPAAHTFLHWEAIGSFDIVYRPGVDYTNVIMITIIDDYTGLGSITQMWLWLRLQMITYSNYDYDYIENTMIMIMITFQYVSLPVQPAVSASMQCTCTIINSLLYTYQS